MVPLQPTGQQAINSDKTRHEVTAICTAYKDQGEGFADVTRVLDLGTTLWARVDENESRKLDGKAMKVVRFWINGSTTDYWMPRQRFIGSTRKV
jgi:hypothetical protein